MAEDLCRTYRTSNGFTLWIYELTQRQCKLWLNVDYGWKSDLSMVFQPSWQSRKTLTWEWSWSAGQSWPWGCRKWRYQSSSVVWRRSLSLWHCQAWDERALPSLWAPLEDGCSRSFAWDLQERTRAAAAVAAVSHSSDFRPQRYTSHWLWAEPGSKALQGFQQKGPVVPCWFLPALVQTTPGQEPVQPCRFPSPLPAHRNPSPPASAKTHILLHTAAHPRGLLPCSSLSLQHKRAPALWAWRRKPAVSV